MLKGADKVAFVTDSRGNTYTQRKADEWESRNVLGGSVNVSVSFNGATEMQIQLIENLPETVPADDIVDAILEDLCGRCSLSDIWDAIDGKTQEEIRQKWVNIVANCGRKT